ncbi:MBL fold metallo-hydrolase [Bradyrhizobium zhanjiangense]|uniref:MBL fold metallo-hydrolase n=1 Tax=Bradyrhizobium zhanjiangense TaxID=1325107 RepID=A0A4Q0Q8V2_9BRAD|nr:MBL fold metallo-hydrolase [Bradyrhizobium zhanjiangense]RXG84826.1 MBL fold metallo-hydrolase [Bradyrhizobium zhanjiangense]
MRLRIHRGTREIGGTCIELESEGSRILLDLGLPLKAKDLASTPLPNVDGLLAPSASLLGIVLSHGHRDHWGLVPKVDPAIPLIMGQATEGIIRAAADFVPDAVALKASHHLEHRKPIQLGPFTITPRLVDHSGFDAYAMEIASGGKRVFYSGDLRAHGRKRKLFDALISDPPRDIDLMLMEGSSLGRLADHATFPSEENLEETFVERFEQTEGFALVACSAQNVDRVVTIYRAAKRTGRSLVIDAYAAEVLKATGHDSIPHPAPGWPNLAVYIPQRQRVRLKAKGIAALVDGYRGFRVWPGQLAESAPRSVMLFRGWMMSDLAHANALTGARVFWSQWDGYLAEGEAGAALKVDCERRGIPFETVHTSGHAGPSDLKRLAAAVAAKRLIPIHTFERLRFPDLFSNVELANDGEWIDL